MERVDFDVSACRYGLERCLSIQLDSERMFRLMEQATSAVRPEDFHPGPFHKCQLKTWCVEDDEDDGRVMRGNTGGGKLMNTSAD